ncbi:MAG: hypothetical protein FWD32_03055 [Firmicutes bacterium]|nr:hypothetical protein [Bacillota bacterium]
MKKQKQLTPDEIIKNTKKEQEDRKKAIDSMRSIQARRVLKDKNQVK